MFIAKLGRWLGALSVASVTAVVVASCGSGQGGSAFAYHDAGPDTSFVDDVFVPDAPGLIGREGSTGCTPKTCASAGWQCGQNGDGCGNILDCGTCDYPAFCGGGGYSKCGGNITIGRDGGPICNPTTCASLGYDCGIAGDGCGNAISCGTCTDPEYCGGGGFNKCGGSNGLGPDGGVPCTPTTCAKLGYNCGTAADGCGGLLTCGTCTDPQYCGGGGFDVCGGNNGLGPDGAPPCKPTTCAKLGYDCGIAGDGCGGQLQCGSCTDPQYCGGGGYDVCGGNNGLGSDGGVPCTPTTCAKLGFNCGTAADGCGNALDCGKCTDPEYCGGGGYDLCGGDNGLGPDGGILCTPATCASLGYNCGTAGDGCGGTLDCGKCTAPDYCGGGGFNACGTTGLLPDGGVPCKPTTCGQLGFNCGIAGDGCGGQLQCGSCTDPQYCGGGGFNLCGGDNGLGSDGGPVCVPTTCAALGYDCGNAADGCGGLLTCGTCTDPQYCGGGGYDLCGGNNGVGQDGAPFCNPTTCAALGFTCGQAGDGCGGVLQCGSCTDPQFCGGGGFNVCGGNNGLGPDGGPLCTPTTCKKLGFDCGSAGDGCGGILTCGTCSDPEYCGGGGFNLCGGNNGFGVDGGPVCTPTTCAALGYDCGKAADGCGGLLSCGQCKDPEYCGGGGVYDTCGGNNGLGTDGGPVCVPTTCKALGYNCGVAADGCGGQLTCGTCTGGAYCGGGGFDVCGTSGLLPDGGVPCNPVTCGQLGYNCGVAGDGCGNQLACGSCTDPQYCGGGGFNVCGGNNGLGADGGVTCVPTTCAALGYNCGTAADGCGGLLTCGSCTNPQFCGGGGYDVCGGNNGLGQDGGIVCVPTTCAALGYTCGQAGDGCGGTLTCGSCSTPQYCGGGGFNVCGGDNGLNPDGSVPCTPATCGSLGFDCGNAADGCGGLLTCGSCANPQYCGGGGYDVCGGNTGLGSDGGPVCVPTTCAALGYDCGAAGDGCGGSLSCGTCTGGAYCGGGGFNVCGTSGLSGDGAVPCTPTTCSALGFNCGTAADGCGNALSCGTCNNPQYCGGGGYDVCGGDNGLGQDGGVTCTPTSCATLGYNCGQAGDGCGGTLSCGSCTAPQFCGGGGFNVCGGDDGLGQDGAPTCIPTTCLAQGFNCGQAGDGCGGTLTCGACVDPQYCGGGGFNVCGGNNGLGQDGGVVCTPATCTSLSFNCGTAADGCGGQLNCGTCTDPEFCGGGGYDVCGGNNGFNADGGVNCTPTTCAALGYNCGVAGDGCGGQLDCGTCVYPQSCGLGGYDVCGPLTDGGSFVDCDSGSPTTVTGFVYDPGGNLPIYNALVYVPIGAVQQPETGVSSGTCGCTAPPAFTSANTGVDGSFTLPNVPAGTAVQIVVQLGKWQITYTENVNACTSNGVGTLTLPSQHSPGGAWPPDGNAGYGNIPQFAVSTGAVDTMECVLLKMGINQAEFVNPVISGGVPTSAGRVHLYQGQEVRSTDGSTSGPGAFIDGTTPGDSAMTEVSTVMSSYDAILFPCQGAEAALGSTGYDTTSEANLDDYADVGGRVFATHYSYIWLYNNTTPDNFQSTAQWAVNGPNRGATQYTGYIDQTFPTGITLAQWLFQGAVGASTTLGQIPIDEVRTDTTGINNPPGQQWMYTEAPDPETNPVHYTFDTPVGATDACGRVVFSDFHVENSTNTNSQQAFPGECAAAGTNLSAQEKLLAFMLFDLTSCVSTPTCTPLTCTELGYTCGTQGDGCGGTLDCGTCVAPQTCGGGGQAGQCGFPDAGTCAPLTCAQQNLNCGPAGDGCGGTLDCGPCTAPQTCGGGGVFGQCGYPDSGNCVPLTCADQNLNCGPAGDGCGNALDCGTCTPPQTCGGGGTGGVCGYPDSGSCSPLTCADQGITCGPAGDGCGNALDCGGCTAPQTCGGGGVGGQCGYPDGGACVPVSCASQGITCGYAGDGCGNELICGSCVAPQTCGGGGVAGQCGYPEAGTCQPQTCIEQNINCGPAGDGCGNSLQCGTCPTPQTCGGGGVAGQCGYPDGGACIGQTCAQLDITCGPAGDGCGNQLNCGTCVAPQTCGGGGVFGKCGYPDGGNCQPETCAQQNINCGPAGDGCGGSLSCGTCTAPQTCGGGGVYGQCGVPDGGACQPQSCAALGISCGTAGDGCGNLLDCGNCASPQTCGGGGVYGQCGYPDAGTCVPETCADQMIGCGPAGDGCGGSLDCGTCSAPDTCGGGGVGGQCGFPEGGACTPETCAQQHISCGPAGDGCGSSIQCGTCTAPDTCGGGGVYGQCGFPDAGGCTPLTCAQQNINCGPAGNGCGGTVQCGTCVAPQTCGGGGVYGQCGLPDAASCTPLSCAQQGIDCGPAGDGCGGTLQCGSCVAPQTCGGGGVGGQCGLPDAGACVPETCAQQGYNCGPAGDGCGGALDCGTCTAPDTCGGGGVYGQCGYPEAGACKAKTCAQQNIDCGPAGDGCGNQLNCGTCTSPQTCGGGGVYGQCGFPDAGACVPETCAKQHITCGPAGDGCGGALDCGTCTAPDTCGGGGVSGQCGYPEAGSCTPETCATQHITCGPAGDGCGGALDCGTCTTPDTCGGGGVFGQCGMPDAATCTPLTCAQQNITCGTAGDGCGGSLDCGGCKAPQTCGGGGVAGQCGYPDGGACIPVTCADQGITCGPAGDGCGDEILCGTCAAPQTCGGGGIAGQCGYPDGGTCTPVSCSDQDITCGPAGDGCGGLLQCGMCTAPQTCGGGGKLGQCGYPDGGSCTPQTCSDQNITCGPAGDGCGNEIMCGTCAPPLICGGGGVYGQCGQPDGGDCIPLTCAEQNITCGPAGDGCGDLIMCGSCSGTETCGGGGTAGQCGGGSQ